jgi:hypothetical protein
MDRIFSPEDINTFVIELRGLGILPAVAHPVHGLGLDDPGTTKALGLKNAHTQAVWRTTKRHPELNYFRVGRRVFCSVSSIMTFLNNGTRAGTEAHK